MEPSKYIEVLKTTNSDEERNKCAIYLAENNYYQAMPHIMDLIKNPKLEKCRGTLIYSLRLFDNIPLSCILYLLDIIIKEPNDDNFEIYYESINVIKNFSKKIKEIDIDNFYRYLGKVCYLYETTRCIDWKDDILSKLICVLLESRK